MELPSTSPSGRNPASRTSRNSLTDRSDVKIAPALPGVSSASRLIASCGTPIAPKSAACWSVMLLLGLGGTCSPAWSDLAEPDPGRLPAPRVERENGQARPLVGPFRPGEMRDRRADDRHLGKVIARPFLCGALVLADPHVHALDHDALPAQAADVAPQLIPG